MLDTVLLGKVSLWRGKRRYRGKGKHRSRTERIGKGGRGGKRGKERGSRVASELLGWEAADAAGGGNARQQGCQEHK